jgi:divalent metal cation (Fe/Co/Zn/Cd) transporter
VQRHFDFHALVCGKVTVAESHAVCDEIEEALDRDFPGAFINIHVEPCGEHGLKPGPCARTASGLCESGNRK